MSEQNKKIIAGLHRKDLTNIKFASALLDMAIEEKKDDLNFALQQAKEVQQIAARESRKKNSIEFATLYWKATLMLAPYFFEDFLYYMEKDRAPDKRFYMPRRRTLKVVVDDLQDLEDGKLDFMGYPCPLVSASPQYAFSSWHGSWESVPIAIMRCQDTVVSWQMDFMVKHLILWNWMYRKKKDSIIFWIYSHRHFCKRSQQKRKK